MQKRRRVFTLLALAVLLTVAYFVLKPIDEPKYQGRSLSEWLAIYRSDVYLQQTPEFEEARQAVLNIGTNALPYLLKWIRYEPPAWRETLRRNLPSRIWDNDTFQKWIKGPTGERASHANAAFGILGTNALAALPELEALMKDNAAPRTASRAMSALASLGRSSLPIFETALADSNQTNRYRIIYNIRLMAWAEGTNTCLPLLLQALTNDDRMVRTATTNVLTQLAPEMLTNAPPQ